MSICPCRTVRSWAQLLFWHAAVTLPLAVALAGCSPKGAAPGNSTTTASGRAAETSSDQRTPSPPTEAGKEVSFQTSDGWTVRGDLYLPQRSPQGSVILLHQRGGSAGDWKPLCLALQKAGFAALAIDQRGAGRSTQGPGPTGDDAPWATSADIAAAIASLPTKGAVYLLGASYGANNALLYATAHPNQVKGVVLFSPGANYHSLDALTPARAYHGPLAIFHDKGDAIAGNGPQQIHDASPAAKHPLFVLDGNGHGAELLSQPDVIPKTVAFLKAIGMP